MHHPMTTPGNVPSKQRGMLLLEALIAILIFSLGILGIIGLQAMSVQQSTDARYRSTASQLADQLMGQMWVMGARNVATLQAQYNTCSGSSCPGYTTWANTVKDALPGVTLTGTTKPVVNVDAAGIITITLYWRAPTEDAAASPHRYDLQGQISQ